MKNKPIVWKVYYETYQVTLLYGYHANTGIRFYLSDSHLPYFYESTITILEKEE